MVDVSFHQLHNGFKMSSEILSMDVLELMWATKFKLTRSEVKTAKLVCKGFSNSVIAKEVGCSENNIKHKVSSILKKTESRRRSQAILKLMWQE